MNLRDLAWFVGLFEGEGCIGLSHQGRPTLAISMTDEDTIKRAHAIVGVGHVKARPTLTKGGKRMWVLLVGRCDEAVALIYTMYPMLGVRRRARAREALDSWKTTPLPKRLRTHCIHGHPFSGHNLYVYYRNGRPCRACRICSRDRSREYNQRKREVA